MFLNYSDMYKNKVSYNHLEVCKCCEISDRPCFG